MRASKLCTFFSRSATGSEEMRCVCGPPEGAGSAASSLTPGRSVCARPFFSMSSTTLVAGSCGGFVLAPLWPSFGTRLTADETAFTGDAE